MINFARTTLLTRVCVTLAFSILTACLATNAVRPAKAQDSRLSGFAKATDLAVSAENIVIETESTVYAIKKIELRGTSMTNSDLAALLDPKSPASMSDRFAKLAAAEIFIPEITTTTKTAPIQKITYQNIKLTDVQKGKAATADIETSHFSATDEKAGTVEGDYGHIHVQAVNLALASRVMSEARKDENEPLSVLYESFSLEGFKLKTGGKDSISMTIAKMAGRNVKGRPFNTRPSDFKTAANDPAKTALMLKDLLTSVEMEEMTATDIVLQSISDEKPFTMSFAKMSMNMFGNAKIGDIDFSSISMKVKGSTFQIGDIDFKGIDFQKLRDFSAKTESAEGGSDTDADTEDNQKAAVFAPAVSQFIVSKIDVSIADDNSTSGEIKGAFSIDHFEVDSEAPIESTPTHVTATLDHFLLDLGSLKDKDLKALTDMGYSKLDLSSRIEMMWNAEAEELTIKDVSINGAGMGAVKLSGLVDNVGKDFFSGDSAAMQAAALGAQIKRVELQINNAGLFEKTMAMQAKAQNTSIDEIKKSYVSSAAIGLPAMLDNRPAAKIIGAALAKFLANPKSFHLIATSANGLGAADFALTKEPATLLDTLDIKATANE